MERFQELLTESNEALKRADHLTSVTFNLVEETKLLMVIVENVHRSITFAMDALLEYDLYYKRITNVHPEFKEKMRLFKQSSARRYNIPPDAIALIMDVQELMEKRRSSSMEFVRRDKFVIASNDFRLRSLDLKKVKDYVERTKMFINKVNHLLKPSDRRSNRF